MPYTTIIALRDVSIEERGLIFFVPRVPGVCPHPVHTAGTQTIPQKLRFLAGVPLRWYRGTAYFISEVIYNWPSAIERETLITVNYTGTVVHTSISLILMRFFVYHYAGTQLVPLVPNV